MGEALASWVKIRSLILNMLNSGYLCNTLVQKAGIWFEVPVCNQERCQNGNEDLRCNHRERVQIKKRSRIRMEDRRTPPFKVRVEEEESGKK